uniref:VWFA domain-containing protein n=1 Tax=Parastrongyloides trichosuri TaxID=131310 RepID=A0A0N4ZT60_PARTI
MYGNKAENLIKTKYEIINNTSPPCQTFVLKCKNGNTISLVDVFIKFKETNKLESSSKKELKKNKFNAHIFVLEGLTKKSMYQNFPKMIEYLVKKGNTFIMNKYSAINNMTIGNSYAMFLNMSINVVRNLKKRSDIKKPDINIYDCKKSYFDKTFIGDIFYKNNYVSLLAENNYYSIFKNTKCIHQIQPSFNYSSFPYGKLISFLTNHDSEYRSTYTGQCKASFYDLLVYNQDFLKYNINKPMFSINWFSEFLNKDKDSFERSDLALTEYFITNSDIFDDSFVFVITDRGGTIDDNDEKIFKTIDDINPFMLVSIPSNFDKTHELFKNIKYNSENTNISSFDIYASLYDIAENIFVNSFDGESDLLLNSLKSKSIFRSIPNRSCFNMGIDHYSCMDSYVFKTILYLPEEVLLTFQNVMLKSLNNKLKEGKIESYCYKLQLKTNVPLKISYALNEDNNIFWKITITVEPGDGIFTAIFDDNLDLFYEDIKRQNSLNTKNNTNCFVKGKYAQYCECNKEAFLKRNKKKSLKKKIIPKHKT